MFYLRGMSRGRRVFEVVLFGLLVTGGSVPPGPAAAADDKVRVLDETPFSSVADVPPADVPPADMTGDVVTPDGGDGGSPDGGDAGTPDGDMSTPDAPAPDV